MVARVQIDCPRCTGYVVDKGEYLLCLPCGWMEEKIAETKPKPPSPDDRSRTGMPFDYDQDKDQYSNPREGSRSSLFVAQMKEWSHLIYSRGIYSQPYHCQWIEGCLTAYKKGFIYCHYHHTKMEKLSPETGFADVAWKEMALRKCLGTVTVTYLACYTRGYENSTEMIAQWVDLTPTEGQPMSIMHNSMRDLRIAMRQEIGDIRFLPDAIEASGLRGW